MKKYEFIRTTYSDLPGYEMDHYMSRDINGTFCSERNAIIAVLTDIGACEDYEQFDLYTLEAMLLSHDIYVSFTEE